MNRSPILLVIALPLTLVMTYVSASSDIRQDRIKRTETIEGLYTVIHKSRLTHSERILTQLQLAHLEAEERKKKRNNNHIHDQSIAQ